MQNKDDNEKTVRKDTMEMLQLLIPERLTLEQITILWIVCSLLVAIPLIWLSGIIAMLWNEIKRKRGKRKNPIQSDWK